MVERPSSIRLLCLALFLVASVGAFAQEESITVQAVPFHRFITQNATLGHFLTANFSEGTGNPYNYAYQPFPAQADIVPVVPGYAPRPDQGLTPLYRWQVDHRPRIYYYYSIYFGNHGSNYRFQGVAGYVMGGNDPRGTRKHYWYSQSYGYYYTLDNEFPPGNTFTYHGVQYRLPLGGSYIFDKIPEPPDPCAGFEEQRNSCELNGNTWDNVNCRCQVTCSWCEAQPVY